LELQVMVGRSLGDGGHNSNVVAFRAHVMSV
jgi:hypothetical protein